MSEAVRTQNIDFVYNVLGVHEFYELKSWMMNEEFQRAIIARSSVSNAMTAQEILQIMKEIYDRKDADRAANPDFSFYTMRKGISKLAKLCNQG